MRSWRKFVCFYKYITCAVISYPLHIVSPTRNLSPIVDRNQSFAVCLSSVFWVMVDSHFRSLHLSWKLHQALTQYALKNLLLNDSRKGGVFSLFQTWLNNFFKKFRIRYNARTYRSMWLTWQCILIGIFQNKTLQITQSGTFTPLTN